MRTLRGCQSYHPNRELSMPGSRRLKKEIAMPTRRFKRVTLAQLLVGGCAVMFGACVLVKHAQAQHGGGGGGTPVFHPSNPHSVPRYAIPSAVPSYGTSPVNGRPPRTAAHSQERASVAKTGLVHHRGRSVVVGSTPEACAWRRGWGGYWFRTSPCS